MKLKRFTEYLLSHRVLMLTFIVLVSLIKQTGALISYTFGTIYAGFITLQKGAGEGALFMTAATLPMVVLLALTAVSPELGVSPLLIWVSLTLTVICSVITWGAAVMLLRQMTWSSILQFAALLGVMAVSVLHLGFPDISDWWSDKMVYLAKAILKSSSVMMGAMQDNAIMLSDNQLAEINGFKTIMSGMVVAMVLMQSLLTVVIARWWQAATFAPGMLKRELHHIRLSQLAGVLFVLSLVLANQGSSVMLDSMPVIYLLFVCAGLSVIHYFFSLMESKTRLFWIALMYVLLLYVPVFGKLVSLVGLLDVWLDLRRRLRKI